MESLREMSRRLEGDTNGWNKSDKTRFDAGGTARDRASAIVALETFRAECNPHNPVKVCRLPVHAALASLISRLVITATRVSPRFISRLSANLSISFPESDTAIDEPTYDNCILQIK